MQKTIKWIDRKFDFNFPAGIFPCIVERLRGTPPRLEELFSNLSSEFLTIIINNSWSIQEHAGHLIDLESLGEKRLIEFLSNAEKLTAADMSNRKTYEENYNSKAAEEILKQFRITRLNLVNKLDNLNEEDILRSSIHPRLNKKMRLVDWAYFMAEHDDHHLAKINEIANELRLKDHGD